VRDPTGSNRYIFSKLTVAETFSLPTGPLAERTWRGGVAAGRAVGPGEQERTFLAQGCRLGALRQVGSFLGTPDIKSM
jgi:hypothetical protein